MAFPILIIKSNPTQPTVVPVKDMSIKVAALGGTLTLTSFAALLSAQKSRYLVRLTSDNALGVGQHTLILNDGTADIASTDVPAYLASLALADGGNFGVVMRNAAGQVVQPISFGGGVSVSNLVAGTAIDAGGFRVLNGSPAVAGTDFVTLDQMNASVVANRAFKEAVLDDSQLDSVNNAMSQATAIYFALNLADTATITITDGTSTEVYTAKTVPAAANDFLIGATAAATQANFVAKIVANSAIYSAADVAGLSPINAAGNVVVLRRAAQLVDTYPDRVFGSSAAGVVKFVNFTGLLDYTSSVSVDIPSVDPGVKSFGVGRAQASLLTNEYHFSRSTDKQFTWDLGATFWQNTDSGTVTASNGLQKVGIDISPVYATPAAIGAANVSGTALSLSHSDHVHAHGDQSATVGTVHNSAGVTIAGTYLTLGSPADVEQAFSNINGLFAGVAKGSNPYVFGMSEEVPDTGVRYMEAAGEVSTLEIPHVFDLAGNVAGMSVTLPVGVLAGESWDIVLEKNGAAVLTQTVVAGQSSIRDMAINIANTTADQFSVYITRNLGTGESSFESAKVVLHHVAS